MEFFEVIQLIANIVVSIAAIFLIGIFAEIKKRLEADIYDEELQPPEEPFMEFNEGDLGNGKE